MSEKLRPQLQGHAQEEGVATAPGVRMRRGTEVHMQDLRKTFLAKILFVHPHGLRPQDDDDGVIRLFCSFIDFFFFQNSIFSIYSFILHTAYGISACFKTRKVLIIHYNLDFRQL